MHLNTLLINKRESGLIYKRESGIQFVGKNLIKSLSSDAFEIATGSLQGAKTSIETIADA